jgi:RHS repeat-associated protein
MASFDDCDSAAANEAKTSSCRQDYTNRIITSGFAYDANGNSLRFRGKYQQPVAAVWTAQYRMHAFIEGDPTLGSAYPNETYQYDSAGYRIVKIDQTGKPMLSLRDEKGSVLSEYLVENGVTHPQLDKDFVYLKGQLLIERTVAPGEPAMTTHSTLKTGSAYNFQLTAQTGHASYAVDISAPSGWRRQVSGLHPDSQNVIAINESEFSPDETNFVRVKIESPEPSGYSAPVSLSFDPDVTGSSSNQIRTVAVSRNGTNIVLRWALNQSNGKQTKLYFQRTDTGTTYLLTPQALNASLTSFTLDSQALASPCGVFWGTQFQTGVETGPGPSSDLGSSRPGEQGTQDGCGSPPPPSPAPATKFVNSYRHLDHLGSLRVARGDSGAIETGVSSALDLYPYGTQFAASNAASTRQFTGHERDESTGQDYMLARYQGAGLARFLSTDPAGESADPAGPLTWNRYTYANDRPTVLVDENGESATVAGAVIGGAIGGAIAFYQGKTWREVGAAAAGGAVSGALMGSVLDTGGASLGALAVAGALSGATGGVVEDAMNGRQSTVEGVAMDAAGGAVGAGLGRAAGAVLEGAVAGRAVSNLPSAAVQKSGDRFFSKAPKGSQSFTTVTEKNGTTKFTYETPGRVPGAKAVYEKTVDAKGKTTSVTKTTHAPNGNVVHTKDKLKK